MGLLEPNLVEDAIFYHPRRASHQLGFQAHILFLLLALVMHLGGHGTAADGVIIVVVVVVGTIFVVVVVLSLLS